MTPTLKTLHTKIHGLYNYMNETDDGDDDMISNILSELENIIFIIDSLVKSLNQLLNLSEES